MLFLQRTKIMRSLRRWLAVAASLAFLALPLSAVADNVVQGFAENGNLQPGWIVALSKTSSTTVEVAPANDPSRIYGVVINPSAAPITLNRSGQQVFVANAGTYPVLVSVVNGNISPGDYISMSNTDGIGAKATSYQQTVLGRAVDGFDGQHNVLTGSGQTAVGRINVSIAPGHNPAQKGQSAVFGPLQRAANSIAGHSVSNARIWAATAVFIAAAAITVTLLVVGVRTGMTAIGRNPLSKHSILLGLVQVVGMALVIFVVGLFGVYLLLRL
jgi:hypothetical protein